VAGVTAPLALSVNATLNGFNAGLSVGVIVNHQTTR
jgi:hypothetical protein